MSPEKQRDCRTPMVVTVETNCRLAEGHDGECRPRPYADEWHAPGKHVCGLDPPCHDGVPR